MFASYAVLFYCTRVVRNSDSVKVPFINGMMPDVMSLIEPSVVQLVVSFSSLRKHAYSNILKILQPKKETFQIKNSNNFHISAQT